MSNRSGNRVRLRGCPSRQIGYRDDVLRWPLPGCMPCGDESSGAEPTATGMVIADHPTPSAHPPIRLRIPMGGIELRHRPTFGAAKRRTSNVSGNISHSSAADQTDWFTQSMLFARTWAPILQMARSSPTNCDAPFTAGRLTDTDRSVAYPPAIAPRPGRTLITK